MKCKVGIQGSDIYDPIKDKVKPHDVRDIAYSVVDSDYDGINFCKQVFFWGGDKNASVKWRNGLINLAKDSTKKKVYKLENRNRR